MVFLDDKLLGKPTELKRFNHFLVMIHRKVHILVQFHIMCDLLMLNSELEQAVQSVGSVNSESVHRVRSVNELYADSSLYSSRDMFSPPSERRAHVIRFELTTGCDYGRCTYCGGFDGIRSRTKTKEEFKEHVDTIFERIDPFRLDAKLRRVFIGGGNALSVDPELLRYAITYVESKFHANQRKFPTRTSLYSRTDAIIQKGQEGLREVFASRMSGTPVLFYWGVESGSTTVLDYVRKGYTKEDLIHAANIIHELQRVNRLNINVSVMVMPGLGGAQYYQDHIDDTVDVLNAIQPKFLTFMGVNPGQKTPYTRKMLQEMRDGTNNPLGDFEAAEQMIAIIRRLNFRTKMGSYDPSIDAVGRNELPFNDAINFYDDPRRIAQILQAQLVQKRAEDQAWKKTYVDNSMGRVSNFI